MDDFMDREIAATEMPEEYKDKKMNILCNDCLHKCEVAYHIYGGKCKKCGSYNTTRIADRRSPKPKSKEETKGADGEAAWDEPFGIGMNEAKL